MELKYVVTWPILLDIFFYWHFWHIEYKLLIFMYKVWNKKKMRQETFYFENIHGQTHLFFTNKNVHSKFNWNCHENGNDKMESSRSLMPINKFLKHPNSPFLLQTRSASLNFKSLFVNKLENPFGIEKPTIIWSRTSKRTVSPLVCQITNCSTIENCFCHFYTAKRCRISSAIRFNELF